MNNLDEDDLPIIFENIVQLIYRDKCTCDNHNCEGSIRVVRILPQKLLKFDLNNVVLTCEAHKNFWESEECYQEFMKNNLELANFNIYNRGLEDGEPDLEKQKQILLDNYTEIIKGTLPFPSLYGKFDV